MRHFKLDSFHKRRKFDPSKDEDLQELKYFLKNHTWKNVCPFYMEFPWENIPEMCKHKYAEYMLSKI